MLLTQPGKQRQSSKFLRWFDRLSAFSFNVEYKKGKENVVADMLSRVKRQEEKASSPVMNEEKSQTIGMLKLWGISLDKIRGATERDDQLKRISSYITTKWPDKKKVPNDLIAFWQNRNELALEDGFLTRDDRIILPHQLRKKLLQDAHMGHPGIVRMKRKIRENYWWPNLDKEIEKTCKMCIPCQRSEKSTAPVPRIQSALPKCDRAGQLVSIDIAGPFYTAPKNQNFLVVMLDHFSGYPEVLATQQVTSRTIIKWLHEQFSRFGNPDRLLSDNGPQFVSEEFEEFLRNRDIQHLRTPIYNPESNGKTERFNRFLKYGLQAYSESTTEWKTAIEELLAHYRATSPKPGLESPAEIFLGRKIRLPFEIVKRPQIASTPPSRLKDENEEMPHLLCRGPYRVGDMVMYKRPKILKGQPPYSQPIPVVEVLGKWTYRLKNGSIWNARKLKRFYEEESEPNDSSPTTTTGNSGSRPRHAENPTRTLPDRTTRGQPPDYFVRANF